MEFRDLKVQYQHMELQINQAINGVLSNACFISGSEVQCLEEKLAEYIGVKHCITCANGTDALVLALMSWGISKGDAVFVPDFTFFSSAEAPAFLGATPIFVDVDSHTYNISPSALESAIKAVKARGELMPKAIVAVDLFGQPANYPEIQRIAHQYGLLVLEDGAQGFGGAIYQKKACSFGDIAITSFFPSKPLGCYGDGGAVFTDSDEWAERIRSLCVHGKGKDKYDNVRVGMNSRLDTIQAAVLNVKLEHFVKHELNHVNEIAEAYTNRLKDSIRTPEILEHFTSSWAQYTVVCRDAANRDEIQNALSKENIPSMIYYFRGMHEMKAFQDVMKGDMQAGQYENASYLAERVLSLPIYPYMEQEQVNQVCDVILRIQQS